VTAAVRVKAKARAPTVGWARHGGHNHMGLECGNNEQVRARGFRI